MDDIRIPTQPFLYSVRHFEKGASEDVNPEQAIDFALDADADDDYTATINENVPKHGKLKLL